MIKGKSFWRVMSCCLTICIFSVGQASAFSLFGYLSPRNNERPIRQRTDYIILHTTEGSEKGALQKLSDNGEAHYMIGSNGHVYKIIDKKRLAFHCGTSMWNGKMNLDNYSIGIEVQGTYCGDITQAQYASLRQLLADLKETYNIADDHILTHSMVAYSRPNRWHSSPARGRKRCGMLFAKTDVRARLGLLKRPAFDPDVKAGRLIDGDPYLAQVLYGKAPEQEKALIRYVSPTANVISKDRSAWDISGDEYDSAKTLYIFPDGHKYHGNQIKDWSKIPAGTKVVSVS